MSFDDQAKRASNSALQHAIDKREDDWIAPNTIGDMILKAAHKELGIRRKMFRHVPITRRMI